MGTSISGPASFTVLFLYKSLSSTGKNALTEMVIVYIAHKNAAMISEATPAYNRPGRIFERTLSAAPVRAAATDASIPADKSCHLETNPHRGGIPVRDSAPRVYAAKVSGMRLPIPFSS